MRKFPGKFDDVPQVCSQNSNNPGKLILVVIFVEIRAELGKNEM
jgi:hypothetical protein